jgi:thiol-disulfide isomerase/thioredoxin
MTTRSRAQRGAVTRRFPRLGSGLLVLVALGCAAGDLGPGGGAGGRLGTGDEADFRLASLEGGELGPGDFPDRVVLVEFWATWCVPCHAQAAILADLHPEVAADGVAFLAVDVGEERDQVARFVASSPFPYPVLLDPESRLADSLGVYSLPTLMVVDPRGRIAYLDDGVHTAEELRRILREAREAAPAAG